MSCEQSLAFPTNLEIALTRADIAKRRGDLIAVGDRWAIVGAINPSLRAAHKEGTTQLFEAKQAAAADAVLQLAIERFPDEVLPLRYFAHPAHNRRDWTEAAHRGPRCVRVSRRKRAVIHWEPRL